MSSPLLGVGAIKSLLDRALRPEAGRSVNRLIVKDVKVLTGVVDDLDKSSLRNLADELKSKLEKGVVVLATSNGDRVSLVATITSNLNPKLHAGKLVKEISSIMGGSGGGRPDMAEAGGKDPSKLPEALAAVSTFVSGALAN